MKRNETLAVLAALTAMTIAGCARGPAADPEPVARRVTVVEAHRSERSQRFDVSGRVESARDAMLSFKAGGIVRQIRVDEGDSFRRGEVLASLDTTEIAAMVTDAVQQREQAQRDVDRLRQLYEQRAISRQQLQDANTGLARALAGERRAKFVLDNTRIVAAFDGHVAMRMANDGELVGEGRPVLRVVDDYGARLVKAGVPGRLIPWLKVGDTARVSVETLDHPLTGTIMRVGAVAEPGTGNFIVEIKLAASDWLREGLVARVELSGPPNDVIALPGGALADGDKDRGVFYIVRNDTVLRRELHIERITGDSVFIRPELDEGTPVVVSGPGFLADGERVQVVDPSELAR